VRELCDITGTHEHPTQALLDLMTVLETRPSVDGMNLLIVGDILHSRVAKSNIALFKKMGANVSVCGPSTLVPKEIESLGVKIYSDLKEAIKKQDIVMTLRIQKERMSSAFIPSEKEFAARYCLTKELLQQASPNVLVMDPGPFNRGVQISSDVADGERSLILKQVENGVWLRMALLHLYLKGQK
jgi:aspartate carbamoyltransferase catalytic subunit